MSAFDPFCFMTPDARRVSSRKRHLRTCWHVTSQPLRLAGRDLMGREVCKACQTEYDKEREGVA